MAVRRGAQWALIATGALIVMIAAALIIAPPFVVRHALQHYLKAEGITADIGHVHADIFTGQISLDDVSGHGPDNRRFRIGHFAVNIDYWPLTDHHIDLSYIRLADAHIDAGRNARQQPTIAGVPIPVHSAGGGQHNWGFGVGEVAVDQVTLRYRAPTHADHPAVDQTLVVHGLHIGPIATWQPQQTTAASIQLRAADGRLDLHGHLRPLGATRRANFTLKASHFPMQAFMPVARLGYVTALDGRLDADQQLSMTYAADGRLTLGVKGRSAWHNAHLATTDGTDVRGDSLSWQGDEQATLGRGHGQPGHIHADGKVALANVVAKRASQLDFRQKSASWNGKAEATLGQRATRVTSHGKLTAQDTHLVSGNWLKLSSAAEHLTGDLNLTLTPDETRVDTDGGFTATGMGLTVPATVDLNSATLNWNGKTTTRLAGNGTHIQTDGHLTSNQLVFDVPKTSHVTADHVAWQGKVALHSAQLFSRRAKGQLEARNVHLSIPGAPIRILATQFGFDGQYAEQPDASGRALRLTLSGDAHSHKLEAVDTAINAPWIKLLQANASGIAIDSLDAIHVADLKASGIRMLGDSHGDGAAIRAVSMQAKQFALQDLQHYRVHDLVLGGTNIHVRHDKRGIGVISQFVGSMTASSGHTGAASKQASKPHAKASSPGAASGSGAAGATYAVDHLHLSGPAIAFVDKTTTPAVHVTGSKLDFTLDNLDTAKPNQDARYTLGLDVGAYGHFDSRGKIAPFAPHGIRMDLNAWLRSLALAPLSGYLDAAMGRRIANGVADGTLNLSATKGQLNGVLDTTLTNFRLANSATTETDIAYGISMNTALKLLRGHNDIIHFRTKILGDVTTPYFSLNNLIREAVLAGLRTALLSNYSPLGLLNNAKNSFLNLFRSVEDRPALFATGKHYVRPADRKYLALIAKAMRSHPGWTLHIAGQAVPADAKALKLHGTPAARHTRLEQLARRRQSAVKDYLAARNVNPARIIAGDPSVADSNQARPAVKFSLDKH